jgi:hypothetical protein
VIERSENKTGMQLTYNTPKRPHSTPQLPNTALQTAALQRTTQQRLDALPTLGMRLFQTHQVTGLVKSLSKLTPGYRSVLEPKHATWHAKRKP